jgi:hypothetical protein
MHGPVVLCLVASTSTPVPVPHACATDTHLPLRATSVALAHVEHGAVFAALAFENPGVHTHQGEPGVVSVLHVPPTPHPVQAVHVGPDLPFLQAHVPLPQSSAPHGPHVAWEVVAFVHRVHVMPSSARIHPGAHVVHLVPLYPSAHTHVFRDSVFREQVAYLVAMPGDAQPRYCVQG